MVEKETYKIKEITETKDNITYKTKLDINRQNILIQRENNLLFIISFLSLVITTLILISLGYILNLIPNELNTEFIENYYIMVTSKN